MKKVLKIMLEILGGLVGLAVLGIAILYFTGQARFEQQFDLVQARSVQIPTDAENIELGEKWAETLCTNCHAPDLSGRPLIEDDAIGVIGSPNLTSGAGGVGASYTDEDWVRALRHGIAPDNTPLMGMPSDAFYYMNDKDLGALIAYLKSIPAVNNPVSPTDLKPLAYILVSLGTFGDVFPAEHIPHDKIPPQPKPGITVGYGQYLARVGDCNNCHGPNLSGGESPVPGSPPGPNITPGGTVAFWSAEEFITTMRTGMTPYGRQLDPDFMPWKEYINLSDEELSAILMYLQSLPALQNGE